MKCVICGVEAHPNVDLKENSLFGFYVCPKGKGKPNCQSKIIDFLKHNIDKIIEEKGNEIMRTIKFKSIPENWRKEYLNLKRNTIRKWDDANDERFYILEDYLKGDLNLLTIEIENTKTGEIFKREVTDVTKFEEWYIISW